ESLGISYKFAWNYIKKIEDRLGLKIVETHRGGTSRGGARLTDVGRELMETYFHYYNLVNEALREGRG
ncbi:MAG: ModE family transcriptional regulator, partial [Thermofilum sp. ex4484_79]